jgi:Mg-chelatase subunit ChlD
VDVSEPHLVFAAPSVETVYAVQDLWQSARRDVNLVMLLDVSGSMRGGKIENVREAASQFIFQMGDDDRITLLAFSTTPTVLVRSELVGTARDSVIAMIGSLEAAGDTALYDSIGQAAGILLESSSPDTTNALIVLTDGLDTSSRSFGFDQRLIEMASANETTIFTIAYGSDADIELLTQLATRANGNFYKGDEISISSIYQEMSAAFGGSVGVGR